MRFWTLYWASGNKQFIAGESRDRAYLAAKIDLSQTLALEQVSEGFDFNLYWKDIPPQWVKNRSPIRAIDLHRVVVNGIRFESNEISFTNRLLTQVGVKANRFDGRLMVATCDLARIWRQKLAVKEPTT